MESTVYGHPGQPRDGEGWPEAVSRLTFANLGVTFEGHQGLEPLLLPEDWDAGPPLRRERAEEGDDAVAADAGGD